MAKKDELIEQAKTLGIPTEGLSVAELEEAIATVQEVEVEEVVEDNPTVKRQKAAKAARAEAKAKLAKNTAKAEKETKAAEKAAAATAKKAEKDTRPIFTDERKLKFKFKKSTPKTLNIDGVSLSLAEIIEDEEIMLELVNGNSNYLEQIY